jgi:hypothetical protein
VCILSIVLFVAFALTGNYLSPPPLNFGEESVGCPGWVSFGRRCQRGERAYFVAFKLFTELRVKLDA